MPGPKQITIIIEDEHEKQTINIPVAHDVQFDIEFQEANTYDRLMHMPSPAIESIRFSFSPQVNNEGIALFVKEEE